MYRVYTMPPPDGFGEARHGVERGACYVRSRQRKER